jgi:hypothetical protein
MERVKGIEPSFLFHGASQAKPLQYNCLDTPRGCRQAKAGFSGVHLPATPALEYLKTRNPLTILSK